MTRSSLRHLRDARALSWFLNVPLTLFVVQSFRGARALYLDRGTPPNLDQFTAALLSLVVWTSFLTLNVTALLLRSSRENGRPAGPSDE